MSLFWRKDRGWWQREVCASCTEGPQASSRSYPQYQAGITLVCFGKGLPDGLFSGQLRVFGQKTFLFALKWLKLNLHFFFLLFSMKAHFYYQIQCIALDFHLLINSLNNYTCSLEKLLLIKANVLNRSDYRMHCTHMRFWVLQSNIITMALHDEESVLKPEYTNVGPVMPGRWRWSASPFGSRFRR